MSEIQAIIKAGEAFLDAFTYDDTGVNGKGGNGGLISRETIRKADEFRMELLRYKARKGTGT